MISCVVVALGASFVAGYGVCAYRVATVREQACVRFGRHLTEHSEHVSLHKIINEEEELLQQVLFSGWLLNRLTRE